MATPQSESIELELGVPQEIPLRGGSTWYFKPQSQNQIIRVSLNQSMNNPYTSTDYENGIIPVSLGASGGSAWVECVELAGAPTCNVLYSNVFGINLSVSGGGGGSYVFTAPLEEVSGSVGLNLASDLQVSNGNLTLNLTSNSDFIQLSQLVQSLTGGIEWMGKTTDTNAQVDANHTLLTTYIQTISGRAPKIGDLVLTADTPPYGWIYTNTYDPSSGQVTGQDWETIGTTAVSIATQTTVGLVKGSNTITINIDGSANLNFGALFYQQGQSIPQGQWRLSPITPNP